MTPITGGSKDPKFPNAVLNQVDGLGGKQRNGPKPRELAVEEQGLEQRAIHDYLALYSRDL